jgi:hypothetical protein
VGVVIMTAAMSSRVRGALSLLGRGVRSESHRRCAAPLSSALISPPAAATRSTADDAEAGATPLARKGWAMAAATGTATRMTGAPTSSKRWRSLATAATTTRASITRGTALAPPPLADSQTRWTSPARSFSSSAAAAASSHNSRRGKAQGRKTQGKGGDKVAAETTTTTTTTTTSPSGVAAVDVSPDTSGNFYGAPAEYGPEFSIRATLKWPLPLDAIAKVNPKLALAMGASKANVVGRCTLTPPDP